MENGGLRTSYSETARQTRRLTFPFLLSSVPLHQLPNLHSIARPACMLFVSHESITYQRQRTPPEPPTLASFFRITRLPHHQANAIRQARWLRFFKTPFRPPAR